MVGSVANEVVVGGELSDIVGGLVWVQRKNGSWWPGQIVGEEQLTENDLAVPRSGTPIKLLGRDDTCLDWFDLETTKAVKAFRCGEYDSCIEKARISAANNQLKFTKYPRRENAIVCALEIEKTCLLKEYLTADALRNGEKLSDDIDHSSDEMSSEDTRSLFEEKTILTQELSNSSISYEETNGYRGRKRKIPYDSEDDGYEGIKRMKGLSDLGMYSEKDQTILGLSNSIPESGVFVGNHCGVNGMAIETLTNGSSALTMRRKRSQVVHIHELLKRDHRPQPVTKVLENTTMVPVHIICDEFANPFERYDVISSNYECEDSNNSRNAELPNWMLPEDDSEDILVDVPYVDWEPHSPEEPSQNIKVEAPSLGHESLDESGLPYTSTGDINQNVDKTAASMWQSKGKRNARHLTKGEEPYSRWKADVHDILDSYMIGHENLGQYSPNLNGVVDGLHRSFPYNHSRLADTSPRNNHGHSLLYEVEVTVEAARSQVQHVPYISLMSKVNGKPITGHPVTVTVIVEALEDTTCDLESPDYLPSGSCELDDEDTEVEAIVEPKSHKKKKSKRGSSHSHRKKSSKSKKRHGSKTRKLSSLSLVKTNPLAHTSKGPTLACIPLKVVFSRINEALNGSRSTHRTGNTG